MTTDTPVGGADSALCIPATGGWSASFNQAYQVLDDVQPGSTYRIGGWAKAHYSPALNPVSILLCRTNGAFGFVPYSPAVTFTLEGLWQFKDTLVTVDPPPLPGESVRFVLSGGESWYVAGFPVYAFFDNVSVELDLSTSVPQEPSWDAPSFRPNPASDKLWVDLPEAPISIVAMDATGSALTLENFQHTSRTLELDVSKLPSGLNVLRIATRSGSHTVRFIKA